MVNSRPTLRKLFLRRAVIAAAIAVVCLSTIAAFRSERPWPFFNHSAVQGAESERAVAEEWVCPMHSFVREHSAGHCPICGMALVRSVLQRGRNSTEMRAIDDSQLIRHLGLRLVPVSKTTISRDIHTYGIVTLADDNTFTVSPKTEGWIKRLLVSSVGQRVQKDQPIYEFYSTELIAKQREYIELLDRKDQLSERTEGEISNQTAQVLAALARERIRARERLREADLSEATLHYIETTHRTVDVVTVLASQGGIISQIGAHEGSFINPMTNVISLVNGGALWLDVTLYPDQLVWIQDGDTATVRYQSHAVRCPIHLTNVLSDPGTRGLHSRIVLPAEAGLLYPGSFADVVIHTQKHRALAVPTSAIVRRASGEFVMRLDTQRSFHMVPVKTGIMDAESTEIVSGLQESDQVALNGQFLLDAAAPSPAGEERTPDE